MTLKKDQKFNLIRELSQKEKDDKTQFQGAIVAFRLQDGTTGTLTICEDLGIRLRLIQESKIQERIMEKQVEEMAKQAITPLMSKPQKLGGLYLG